MKKISKIAIAAAFVALSGAAHATYCSDRIGSLQDHVRIAAAKQRAQAADRDEFARQANNALLNARAACKSDGAKIQLAAALQRMEADAGLVFGGGNANSKGPKVLRAE